MTISNDAISYLKQMADNYDLELAEMKNNEIIITVLKRQEACIESLIERNTRLKEELNNLIITIDQMLPKHPRF
jgi:hypothetical protein